MNFKTLLLVAAALFSLSLVACGDKEEDTAAEATE
jgi:uncharacterized lipoprotein YehR (DUF1307 family)